MEEDEAPASDGRLGDSAGAATSDEVATPRPSAPPPSRAVTGASGDTSLFDRLLRAPLAMLVAVVVAYLPSLPGDWLDYDDDWLIRDNELLQSPGHVVEILTALDREHRLMLGAEYLPVRDLVVLLTRGVLGLDVLGHRVVLLVLYAIAMIAWLRWARALGDALARAGATGARAWLLAVWLFALHPVHAESVAWLAGYKDVLALLFTGLALLAYESIDRDALRGVATATFVALACLSKSMAVITPLLLLLVDLRVARRPRLESVVPSALIAVVIGAVHAHVGATVGMIAEPVAPDLVGVVLTMLVVLARYVGVALLVQPESVIHEVPAHGLDPSSGAALVGLTLVVLAAILAFRRGARTPLFALAWFLVSLAPVSQVLAPLQNRMADRYLLVALFGLTAALATMLEWGLVRTRAGASVAEGTRGAALVTLLVLTALRAHTFADRIALFAEATEQTSSDAIAPFQLAMALVAAGDDADAEPAFLLAMGRDQLRTEHGRAAGNNLGMLLVRVGRPEQALALYQDLVARYPDDPRVLHNLAMMEAGFGMSEVAAAHRRELAERFPDYRPGHERPGPL